MEIRRKVVAAASLELIFISEIFFFLFFKFRLSFECNLNRNNERMQMQYLKKKKTEIRKMVEYQMKSK